MGKKLFHQCNCHTVSIILTFGTSALVERKEKADIQRQTAMMVIHDIDVCVDQMEKMAKDEEEKDNAVKYILAHLDEIESLPEDTLDLAMGMLADLVGMPINFENAKENIFKSSQDIWSNLDNMAFIDNMESFYRERKYLEAYMAKSPIFVKPISFEEYYQIIIDSFYRRFCRPGKILPHLCPKLERLQRPEQVHHEYQ
jgi:hypothetical protein